MHQFSYRRLSSFPVQCIMDFNMYSFLLSKAYRKENFPGLSNISGPLHGDDIVKCICSA